MTTWHGPTFDPPADTTHPCVMPSYFRADKSDTCRQPGVYQVTGDDGPINEWVCDWHSVDVQVGMCPACGEAIDYCQGHGPMGDADGYLILHLHERGIHDRCAPRACSADNR